MTTPRDAIGLSDRLRDRFTVGAYVQPTHLHCPDYSKGRALLDEAATQLDALQADLRVKEQAVADMARTIDALQARVKELEAEQAAIVRDYQRMNSQLADEMKHATRAEQERDEAYERAAKVAEQFGEPYAIHTNTGAMMYRAQTRKIAGAIRRLAAGTEKGKRE